MRTATDRQGVGKMPQQNAVYQAPRRRFLRRRHAKRRAVLCAVAAAAVAVLAIGGVVLWLAVQGGAPVAAQVYSKTRRAQKPPQTADARLQSPAQRLAQQPFLMLFNEWNPIPRSYTFTLQKVGNTSFEMQPEAAQQLEKLMEDGRARGLDLVIRSTYRSHEQQQANFNRKLNAYLAQGLDKATAEEYTRASIATPGRSEHETGLAADIANSSGRVLGPWFAQTPEYAWLMQHCTEYGFIQRYPENRQDVTGVYYESWHYRYVGVDYAADIAASGLTLEEYLSAA